MNPNMLIAILTFAALALSIYGLFAANSYRQERRRFVGRIRGVLASQSVAEAAATPAGGGAAFTRQIVGLAAAIGLKWGPAQETGQPSYLGRLLQQAGFRRQHAVTTFFGLKVIATALFIAATVVTRIFVRIPMTSLVSLMAGVAIALLGWYLPDIALRLRIMHRKEMILEGFPDALDLMVVCVEAGMGLDGALARVGEEVRLRSPLVGAEFHSLNLELRGGKTRRDALHNMAMRTGLEEISAFTGLLVQTDRFGTSIAQALRVHADAMRVRRAQRAEELAAKLPVKLVFPLIFFIFPSIFVVIIGPAAIRIFRSVLITAGQ